MIDETTREAQIRSGRWAYISTFLDRAIGHPTLGFDFTVDRRRHRARAWQVLVANAGAAGSPPFTWGPGIDPADGALDLCVFALHGVRDVLALAWSLLTGDHRRGARARYFKIRDEITIRTSEPALVQGDGEIIGKTPITLSVARAAIRVVVPRSLEDIPSLVGSPADPRSRAAVGEASAAAATDEPTVAHDVDVMVGLHSRSWVLQGIFKHPFTKIGALDAAIFMRVNKLALGALADRALVMLSNGMHYGEGWAAVAVIMVLQDAHHGMRVTAEALVVLWATMLTVNFPLKRWFRRRRPFIAFVDARVVGPRPKDFSFPSGHTAAAFAGALLFGTHLPFWAPLFYVLACVVGFSRVYLGVHYPGDVVLGGLVGTMLAIAYRALLHHWWPGVS
jgi:membrane-associated phospholipid phosphatase